MSLKNERVVIEREEEDIKTSEPLDEDFESERAPLAKPSSWGGETPCEVVIKPKKKTVKTEKPKRNTYQSHLNGTISRMRDVVREELDAYKKRKEEAKQRAKEEAERKAKEEEEKRLFNEWKKAQENKKESSKTVIQSKDQGPTRTSRGTVKKVVKPKAIVEERDLGSQGTRRDEDNTLTDAPAQRKSKKPVHTPFGEASGRRGAGNPHQKRGGLKPIDTRSTVPQDFVEDSIW
jgi:hypothetical protein